MPIKGISFCFMHCVVSYKFILLWIVKEYVKSYLRVKKKYTHLKIYWANFILLMQKKKKLKLETCLNKIMSCKNAWKASYNMKNLIKACLPVQIKLLFCSVWLNQHQTDKHFTRI